MTIELRHLRSFVAVAEEGGISNAAERLFITQPALSRQMQQLERAIGEPLLLRGPRGIELTEAGRELLARARVAIEAAEDAFAVGDARRAHGRLVLGVPLAGTRQRWFDLTQAFVEEFPGVELELREALSENLQRQVLDHELDAAITLAPIRVAGLEYRTLLEERMAVWLHRSHPLADRAELTLSDFEGEVVALLGGPGGRGSGFNSAIRELFADTAVAPRFEETSQLYPPRAIVTPSRLSISVPLDFPEAIVGVRLVPPSTLPFEFVQRPETNRSAVRAFSRFAAEHLPALACKGGMAHA